MAWRKIEDAKMAAVADAIRSKTGGTEKMTPDQMAVAITGIETGGGGGASGIYMAKITPASDVSYLTVTHNLGTTDILMAVCWAESFGDFVPSFNGAVANIYLKSSVPFRTNSSSNHENLIAHATWSTSSSNVSTLGQPTSTSYFFEIKDENTVHFPPGGASAAKHCAGVTYTVIIMAASAFKETEG